LRLPLLLIVTSRPGAHLTTAMTTHVVKIDLKGLDATSASSLVQEIAREEPLPAEIVRGIISRSDGVPLFLEELTMAALETASEAGHGELKSCRDFIGVPPSLQASLLARLDRVGPPKATAQSCAALGRTFSLELVASVTGEDRASVGVSLNSLVDQGLLLSHRIAGQGVFAFRHALVQDVAYGSLLRDQRREVHLRIAKAFETEWPEITEAQPEILAHHFTEAGSLEPAITYWLKAGKRAVDRSANVEAVDNLTRCLQLISLLPSSAARGRLELEALITLGPALMATKGYGAAECLENFRRAGELLSSASSSNEHMMVHWGIWNVHYGRAELTEALSAAQECLETATRYRIGEAMASRLMGQTLCTMGSFVDARLHLERAIALSRSGETDLRISADNHVTSLTYLSLTLWPLGHVDQAARAVATGLARARALGHVITTAIALHTRVVLGTYGGDPILASQHASEGLAFSTEHKLPSYTFWMHFNQGALVAQSGDPRRGIEIMNAALGAAPTRVKQQFRPRNLAHLAAAHYALNEADKALALIEEAFEIVHATNERQFEAELHRVRGEILLRSSHNDRGEAELQLALTVARRQHAQLWALRAAISLALFWQRNGKHIDARAVLEPIRGWFTEGSHLPDLVHADAVLGKGEFSSLISIHKLRTTL
jgi:tetratricopeptide (TPR) repeat protein